MCVCTLGHNPVFTSPSLVSFWAVQKHVMQMETKRGGRLSLLCLLIRYKVRIKSPGNYLLLLGHSVPPGFHNMLVGHHDRVGIIMKETCLLLMICYSDDISSSPRTWRPSCWCEHKGTMDIQVCFASSRYMLGHGC